jgi:hypothetical protein
MEQELLQDVVDGAAAIASSSVNSVDVKNLLSEVSTSLGHGANFAWDTLVLQFRLLGIAEIIALLLTVIACSVATFKITEWKKEGKELNPFIIICLAFGFGLMSYLISTRGPEAITKTFNPEYHAISEIVRITTDYVR